MAEVESNIFVTVIFRSERMTPQSADYTILRKINSTGRNVIVQCADDELYENEVLLLLLLHHQFGQHHIDLKEGRAVILPDFTAETFLRLKIEFLSSEKTAKDLFFPEKKLPGDIISDNEEKNNISLVTESQKQMSNSESRFIKDNRSEEDHSMNHIDVEESNDYGVSVKLIDSGESNFAIQEENEMDIQIQT